MMQQTFRPVVYCALTVVALGYGGWSLLSKMAVTQGAPPLVFAFYRSAGSVLVMFLMTKFEGREPASKSTGKCVELQAICDVRCFLPLGALMACNNDGFIVATSFLSPITIAIMQPTVPVVAAIMSAMIGIEDISVGKLGSIICSVAGAIIVILFGEHVTMDGARDNTSLLFGCIALFINVIGSAAYWVLQKSALNTYPPVLATATAYVHATWITWVLALLTSGPNPEAWALSGSSTAWFCVGYSIVVANAINKSVQGWANKHTKPSEVTAFLTLLPFFAALLSWLLLNVVITRGQLLGGLAIIAGLTINLVAQSREDAADLKQRLVSETA